MASKRRNMFHKNKKQETTENGTVQKERGEMTPLNLKLLLGQQFGRPHKPSLCNIKRRYFEEVSVPIGRSNDVCRVFGFLEGYIIGRAREFDAPHLLLQIEGGFLYNLVQETGKAMANQLAQMAEKNRGAEFLPQLKWHSKSKLVPGGWGQAVGIRLELLCVPDMVQYSVDIPGQ
ncbi:hypothetical protein AAG570_001248 [Ranatra chinensis]|uniref:Uncharacterized protein n=1 Tax=Ranatra chinensis TaxID=642074 RepID=A0ABD0YD74_9HEMI